jgi:hypothetical protein
MPGTYARQSCQVHVSGAINGIPFQKLSVCSGGTGTGSGTRGGLNKKEGAKCQLLPHTPEAACLPYSLQFWQPASMQPSHPPTPQHHPQHVVR